MTTKDEALERAIDALTQMIACHDELACPAIECAMQAIIACREALAQKASLERARDRFDALSEEEKTARQNRLAALVRGLHINREQEWANMERDLNCPACGGSGHVDDVKPDALAQKGELEPVAWMLECPTMSGDTGWILSWSQSGAGLCDRLRGEEHEKPLYTAPPKRKPLTDEEIGTLWNRFCDEMGYVSPNDADDMIHEIEAHHGIGGEA